MSREQKLEAIAAKCRELLAISQKRTPGQWIHELKRDSIWSESDFDLQIARTSSKPGAGEMRDADQRRKNAEFIASCAGAAEAGWRATLAAIQTLDAVTMLSVENWQRLADEIISAWEGQYECNR